jgi:hypothetical protein
MTDLNSFKVPIFPGVNDAPLPPNATRGGNGSHLIEKFNGLIDALIESQPQGVNCTISFDPAVPSEVFVFHANVSETTLNELNGQPLYLGINALAYRTTELLPGNEIQLADVIKIYGQGYYFVIGRDVGDDYFNNTVSHLLVSNPRGLVVSGNLQYKIGFTANTDYSDYIILDAIAAFKVTMDRGTITIRSDMSDPVTRVQTGGYG